MCGQKKVCVSATALFVAVVLFGAVQIGSHSFAAGNSHGDPGSTRSINTCRSGLVWDRRKQICVRAESGVIPDFDLTEYAFALAQEGRYQEAIGVLELLANPNTPQALNYRGYATRKLGRIEEGISYYRKSVALDPKYAHVREYLGEAYVSQGKLDLAREQLRAIQVICGTTCEEFRDLNQVIEAAERL